MKIIGFMLLGALAGALGCAGPAPGETSSEPVTTTAPAPPLQEPWMPAPEPPPAGTCAGVDARCETTACCDGLGCFDAEYTYCRPDSASACTCSVLLR
ncbi:MAG TPA: hypothetical protein VIG99_17060 [Myxococcaceae bacterium]|jgi:hypothetical protein